MFSACTVLFSLCSVNTLLLKEAEKERWKIPLGFNQHHCQTLTDTFTTSGYGSNNKHCLMSLFDFINFKKVRKAFDHLKY